PAARDCDRGAAALRGRRPGPVRRGRGRHRAARGPERAHRRRHRGARAAPLARLGQGGPGRLRLRERRLARRARRLRGECRTGTDALKKVFALVVVVAGLGAAFAYVNSTNPAWYVRLRYPLRYQEIVRGHSRNYRLDPALLAAVIYQESKFHAPARP